MELLGEFSGYILYRNSDGFIEGYKKKGKRMVGEENLGTKLAHVVTDCKTVEEFEKIVNRAKLKPKPPQQPTLL